MGSPMCENLVKSSHCSITVWNRTKSKTDEFVKDLKDLNSSQNSVQAVDSPQQAIQTSDVLITMLFDRQAFNHTILSHNQSLKDKTVIQMGTLSVNDNLELSQAIEALGATYIEAPVLGTGAVAKAGKLQILIGAPSEDCIKTYNSIWSAMGTPHYLGKVGSASTMKIALNNMVVGQTALFATSMALVDKAQLSQEKFLSILKSSALFCPYYEFKFQPMVTNSYTGANLHFDIKGAGKDMKFAQQTLESLDIDSSMQSGINELIANSIKQREEAGVKETEDMASIYAALIKNTSVKK